MGERPVIAKEKVTIDLLRASSNGFAEQMEGLDFADQVLIPGGMIAQVLIQGALYLQLFLPWGKHLF